MNDANDRERGAGNGLSQKEIETILVGMRTAFGEAGKNGDW